MATLDGDRIVAALRGAFTRGASRGQLLGLAVERIRAAGPPYTSVYAYMLHGDELVLEAWSGRETDHTRIPVGTGVCGTADGALCRALFQSGDRHRRRPRTD